MNILALVAELLVTDEGRTDRQPDITRFIVAFLNFANVPKN
jgi:hypothetical protein